MTAPNGDPFVYGSAKQGPKLNGKAVSFSPVSPSGLTSPISHLNYKSDADDGPLIVSSDGTSYPANRLNGPGKAVQKPVGTRGEQATPKRAKKIFSTDTGPNIKLPGGHYMKIENLAAADVTRTLKVLGEEVSE